MTALHATPPMLDNNFPEPPENRLPLQRHLLIQAEQFCACGYNVHSQTVVRYRGLT